eukprot:3985811-Ditylum_brightwellii.AAC.2
MLLGGKVLQHWQQFKSQAMGLPILGVLNEDEEESSGEERRKKMAKRKRKRARDRVLQVQLLQLE